MMRALGWLAGSLLLPGLLALALAAAIDSAPLVVRAQSISPDSVAHARRLLAGNDPRYLRRGEQRRVALPAGLIDDGLNHLAGLRYDGRASFALDADGAEIRVTLPLPRLAGARYLNLKARLRSGPGEPQFEDVRLGALPLPPAVLDYAIATAARHLGYGEAWQLARQAVRQLNFIPGGQVVLVHYVWQPEILDRARAIALAPADVVRLERAQQALAATLAPWAPGSTRPLTAVLAPLLTLDADNASAQRRASLLVLASYMAGRGLEALVPEAKRWPRPPPLALTLRGRHDSAQHFVVSAALAAWAGEPVADAIGLYKELEDARRGSGFSFADLAADRAGTRFGEALVNAPERIQPLLAGTMGDADLAPRLDDLPEFLAEREFRRRYGGIDSPAYRRLTDEIERRLDAMPLYR